MYKSSSPGFTYVREIQFELLADARKVGVNRIGLDVMTHPNGVETECVCCGLYREVVKTDEGEVGVQSGTVVVPSANVYGLSQCNGLFSNEPLP